MIVSYAVRVNGLTGIALTKLDVLDTLSEIKIATAYRIDGETPVPFPASTWEMGRAEPVYETRPPRPGRGRQSDLPENTRVNLERIEQLVGVPIALVSVGSRRSQIIRCW